MSIRSRSGCVTCKGRHLKCDETKPTCELCASRGVECGGYSRALRWSTKHEKLKTDFRCSMQMYSGKPKKRRTRSKDGPSPASSSATNQESLSANVDWAFVSEPGPLATTSDFTAYNDCLPLMGFDVPNEELQWSWATPATTDTSNELSTHDANLVVTPYAQQTTSPFIPPALTDIPLSLIEYWFRDVCALWSQYDSDMNFNRIIATTLWSTSAAVSTSLQSMSSAYLSSKIPHMKKTSISLMLEATKAIKSELQTVKSSHELPIAPLGLLYGLFCVGTSICWLNATQLGVPFLREAKALLYRINQQKRSLTDQERGLLHIFNKSWTYCELLLSMVADTGIFSLYNIDQVNDVSVDNHPTVQPVQLDVDDTPHPWTGVSTACSRLLTETMRLCRDHRVSLRNGSTAKPDPEFLKEAKVLEERFFELDFTPVALMSETGDDRTPLQHLVDVAEAYRLAGLIHLYQTFPGLVSSSPTNSAWDAWEESIVPLSIRLVQLLEQLPPDSGSKMTQPLLCITASTGLRFGPKQAPFEGADFPRQCLARLDQAESIEGCEMLEYIGHLIQADKDIDDLTSLIESRSEIVNARCFVMSRLEELGNVLPPGPISVAKSLVQAIWNEYDDESQSPGNVHWVDVMEKHNLRSLFG
ncbi:fungal-specific transcription factor domain-containing protein [Dactylonectria estremocensis]|uniref:Fungal-specific transcription factor domain-containing protein n=1 Tax=Dactylonectria estremocensis TaxID=1079267 RepID=A0A9P9DZQ2_9HYPO|nr:fungal-specific transcription factor domain-containing protein [Dactylonectria estremocensis]